MLATLLLVIGIPSALLALATGCACVGGSRCDCPLLQRSRLSDAAVADLINQTDRAA